MPMRNEVNIAVLGGPVSNDQIAMGTLRGSRLMHAFELVSCDGFPKRTIEIDGKEFTCVFVADGQMRKTLSKRLCDVPIARLFVALSLRENFMRVRVFH